MYLFQQKSNIITKLKFKTLKVTLEHLINSRICIIQ